MIIHIKVFGQSADTSPTKSLFACGLLLPCGLRGGRCSDISVKETVHWTYLFHKRVFRLPRNSRFIASSMNISFYKCVPLQTQK